MVTYAARRGVHAARLNHGDDEAFWPLIKADHV
jgi:hypothetical protein